jgi:catechol 2,3-dioxygenase-like lactoylglutathione lyase family enzyme
MNYRIDHLAFRTLDKTKCIKFFKEVLGYKEQAEFTIYFDENKTETALCTALEPSNRANFQKTNFPWQTYLFENSETQEYVLSPEIFISEGSPGSIVYEWAKSKGGGGLHHIALQVPPTSTIEKEVEKWLKLGWTEGFSSEIIKCDDLCQIFTKPSIVTGVIFEIIERKEHGFCKDSVKLLMESTRGD